MRQSMLPGVHVPRLLSASLLFYGLSLVFVGVTGCKVQVDKSEDRHNVKVATPFGSISVNQNQSSAADVGLPAYPGASLEAEGDGNGSAKVDMGFGSWKLHVRVAHYKTADNQDQVLTFYRKALGEYGDVIECEGKRNVGMPARTREGLSCEDDNDHHSDSSPGDIQLKAGSTHHQHLVILKSGEAGPTHFTLIALELPHSENQQQGTN